MDYCGNCDIAYEGRNCPLCEANKEINNLNDQLRAIELELKSNEEYNTKLENKIAELEGK